MYTIEEALALEKKNIAQIYKTNINPGFVELLHLLDFDKCFVRAEDIYVWDDNGKRYLDFLGGYGSLNIGHNHQKMKQSLKKLIEQSNPNIIHTRISRLQAALAQNLAEITPGKLEKCFFCNSGAEAVEGALKIARASTGKKKIVYCENSFHGKTLGALTVTGKDKYKKPFLPLIPECISIPFDDCDALEKQLKTGDVAGFIVEPIQGEGGIIVPRRGYLKEAAELCQKYNALLILDEIQTGLGRTGYMFAAEYEQVTPDIITIAKSLSGGYIPIGTYIVTSEVWERAYGKEPLLHTSTFGGNDLACAAGITALNIILEEKLSENAQQMGNFLLEELKKLKEKHKMVKEVRGRGLMIGLEFYEPSVVKGISNEYLAAMVAAELLNHYQIITAYTLNNPNVIRLEPPLTVKKEHLEAIISALDEIFGKYKGFLKLAVKTGVEMLKRKVHR